MSNKNQPIEERLSQLWQEGARDIALSFLRRAVHPELTLAELEAILQFDAVNKELAHIHLRDILAVAPRLQAPAPAQAPRQLAAATPSAGRKRSGGRRSPEQTEGMKRLLLSALEAKASGYSTPQLCDKLKQGGFKADAPTATLLLRSMESAGEVHSDNGRPKTWRLKNAAVRRAPAPMFIRKAGAPEGE